jgi:hypothetical protein
MNPRVGVARVAYVITSYKLPEQILRLASVIRAASPGASIVLHHDDRLCGIDLTAARRLRMQLVEPSTPVNWGEASQLEMVIRCLRFCLASVEFDWLVMLSGQDYPIRPIVEIERALGEEDCDALVEARPCPRPGVRGPVDEFSSRYYFRWWHPRHASLVSLARATTRKGAFVRTRAMPSGDWIGTRAVRTPFGAGLICHRGSDWFSLSRAAVKAIDAFAAGRADVLRYYRRTLIPTESFIQTVLASDGSLTISGDTRRYTVWDAGPHQPGPDVLRLEDLDAMLASGFDFGRKFDPTVDSAVIDEIDRRVHAI